MKLITLLLLIIPTFVILCLLSNNTYAQLEIPTNFTKFESDEYEIEIEYPVNWQTFGDIKAGDYNTDIAIFAPSEEVTFKKFNSIEDYLKFDYRVAINLDYSYLLPKLNLNYLLDKDISDTKKVGSGFKNFKLFNSTTKSKLGDKDAYEFTYQLKKNKEYFKYLSIATIVNDNQVLWINFKAPAKYFDLFLPTFKHMIDSFKFKSSK